MKARTERRLWWLAAVAAGCGLCFAPLPGAGSANASKSLAVRLFAPIAALTAGVQWVRADLAFRNGRVELFLARAQTALELAPEAADGWITLAKAQAYVLGSAEREPDPVRRLAWVQAGLATAAEGERAAANPGELAFCAGLIMLKVATSDPQLPWPGGLTAVWEAAAVHFERAGARGFDVENSGLLALSAHHAAQRQRDPH